MSDLLKDVADKAGGLKELGCKIGKSYNTMAVFKRHNKNSVAKMSSYAIERAVELFEKTGETAKYSAVHNNILIEFKIQKLN